MHQHRYHQRHHQDEEDPYYRRPPPTAQKQATRGYGAIFTSGYPIQGQRRDGFVERPRHPPPHPQRARVPSPPPDTKIGHGRVNPKAGSAPRLKPARKVHGQRKVYFPSRHVYFELPPKTNERTEKKHDERKREPIRRQGTPANLHPPPRKPGHHADIRRPASPSPTANYNKLRKPSLRHHDLRNHGSSSPYDKTHNNNNNNKPPQPPPRPPKPREPREPSPRPARHRPHHYHHHQHHQHPPPPLRSDRPTLYIITYALKHTPTDAAALHLIANNLPPSTPHLYTIQAFKFTPPPARLCAEYSGLSPQVQDHVLQDPRANGAVSKAVRDVLRSG